jgi:hypothetical protein
MRIELSRVVMKLLPMAFSNKGRAVDKFYTTPASKSAPMGAASEAHRVAGMTSDFASGEVA